MNPLTRNGRARPVSLAISPRCLFCGAAQFASAAGWRSIETLGAGTFHACPAEFPVRGDDLAARREAYIDFVNAVDRHLRSQDGQRP